MHKKIVRPDQEETIRKLIGSSISSYFRDVRAESGVTQDDVAARLGVSTQTVRSLEVGRTRWNIDNLVRFAAVLSVDLGHLLRTVAAVIDDEAPEVESFDPILAQVLDAYARKDLATFVYLSSRLAVRWKIEGA